MGNRAGLQKRCAVFKLDELSLHEPGITETILCNQAPCTAVVELCIDGITKVTGGNCEALNQGSVATATYRSSESSL